MTTVPARMVLLALLVLVPAVWSMGNENTALVKSLALGTFAGAALVFLGPAALARALKPALPVHALGLLALAGLFLSPSPSFALPALLYAGTLGLIMAASASSPRLDWFSLLALSSCLPLAAGLAQLLGIDPTPWGQQVREHFHGRVCATLGNPNFFAAFLAGIAPFFAVSAFRSGLGALSAAGLTGMACAGLIASGSKGGLAGFLAAAAVTWAAARRARLGESLSPQAARLTLIRLACAALIGAAFALALMPGTIRSRLLLTSPPPELAGDDRQRGKPAESSLARDESIRFRILTWTMSLAALAESPLVGHGPGRFQVIYPRFRPPEIIRMFGQHSYMTDHPENLSIEIAVELGVLGLGLWIWFLVFLARRLLAALARPDPGTRRLAAACAGGLTGIFAANTFGLDIHYGATAGLAACLAGVSIGLGGRAQVPETDSSFSRPRPLTAGAAAGLILALAWAHIYASDAALARAIGFSSRGNWDRAVSRYRDATRLNPANVMARYFGGSALLDRGQDEDLGKARALFDSVNREAPDYVLLNYKYWLLYNRLGLKAEAARALERQIELDPLAAAFFLERGRAAFEEGRREDARNDFEKAIRLEPDSAAGYQYLGNLLVTQERYREALAVYADGLERVPDSVDLNYNAAVAAYRTGNNALALSHARAALRANPGHTQARTIVGKIGR